MGPKMMIKCKKMSTTIGGNWEEGDILGFHEHYTVGWLEIKASEILCNIQDDFLELLKDIYIHLPDNEKYWTLKNWWERMKIERNHFSV